MRYKRSCFIAYERILVRYADVSVNPRITVRVELQNESASWKLSTSMLVAGSIAVHKAKFGGGFT